MEFGASEDYLLELQDAGRDVPALERKPELTLLQAEAFDVYWLISAGRPIGFGGELGIPTADILLAAQAFGFEAPWFLHVVRAMDTRYLESAYNRRAKNNGHRHARSSPGPKAVPPRRGPSARRA